MEDQRTLVDIELPTSGLIAKVVTYFLRSESRAISVAQYEGAKVKYVNDEVVIDQLAPDFVQRKQEKKVLTLVKKLFSKDGTEQPFNAQSLQNLPEPDFNILLLACDRVLDGQHPTTQEGSTAHPEVPSKKK